jgi:hypothetical protein
MFDVNPGGISRAFVSIGFPITTTNWVPIVRTSSAFSRRHTGTFERTIFCTWAAAAVIELAELTLVTKFGCGNPTLATLDIATWLFSWTACFRKDITHATGWPSIIVALIIWTVSTVACTWRTLALRYNLLAEVFCNA